MSAETARLVLTNRTLRWSSPAFFNDPFDVPRELAFGLKPSDIQGQVAERLVNLIEDPARNLDDLSPKARFIVEAARASSAEAIVKIVAGLRREPQTTNSTFTGFDELRALWKSWYPHFRILCLCERPDVVSMWYHYATKYTGAVIELACDDQLDSAWLQAAPVEYPEVTPDIFETGGWARLSILKTDAAKEELYRTYTYTKSPDWAYEREWRVATWSRPGESGLFSDYPLRAKEIRSLYVGPLMTKINRSVLIEALADVPHVRVYDVCMRADRRMVFNEAG
jgi:Protein of unknown function (DUF2971)